MEKTNKKPKLNFIKKFFVGFVSNNAAIEGSREYPWWVAIILGIFSIAIALVPTFVSLCNTSGAAIFAQYNYDYDRNIHQFAEAMTERAKTDPKEKLVFDDNRLLAYEGGTTIDDKVKVILKTQSTYRIEIDDKSKVGTQYEFIAYYFEGTMGELYDSRVQRGILLNQYVVNTTDLRRADITYDEGTLFYCPNYLLLFTDGFGVVTYKTFTTNVAAGSAGYDFSIYKAGDNFVESFKGDTIAKTFGKFLDVLNGCYENSKVRQLWTTTGIYAAVFTGMILILGLMLFLMTRGKNNTFNYLNYMDTQKMVLWAGISPALLSLVLGFLIPKFAMMFFIIFMGVRVMWISMKQLRPMA